MDRSVGSVRLLSRLLRQHVYSVVPYRGRLVVMGYGQVFCFEESGGELLAPPSPIVGSRPLGVCVSPSGIYYGEYRTNRERRPIRILHSLDGVGWDVVRTLDGVRHIHGIFHDPFTDALWMTTGDEDHESAIWCSPDGFRTLERVVHGCQQARAVPLLFREKHLFFGSDTPDEVNYLYRLDRASGSVTQLIAVEGSVFHAATAGRHLLLSTAVEKSEINQSKEAVLYGSIDGEAWRILARHRKDIWHKAYFQYGQLLLPTGSNGTGQYWYSTLSVKPDYAIYAGKLDA
jgi:hypothetical protein